MEIPSHPARPSSPGPLAAAPRVPVGVPEGEVGTPAPASPPAARRDGIDVVTETHEGTGVTLTSIVSRETGEVINQFPLEQVLDLVALLLEQHRAHNEKGKHHGEH